MLFVLFCTLRFGWGWKAFAAEANTGRGIRVPGWMRGYMTYVIPIVIIAIFIIGILNFQFADNFTIWSWIKGLF